VSGGRTDGPDEPLSSSTRVQAHFDAHGEEYVEKFLQESRELYRRKNRFLAAHAAAAQRPRVLDIGAGGAIWSELFLEEHPQARVTCIDLSWQMVQRIRGRPRLMAVQADALRCPFRDGSFDLVSVDALMHHLIDYRGHAASIARISGFLRSLRPLLAPGGRIVIREIYHESIVRQDFTARLVYELSTASLPAPLTRSLKALGIRSQGAGVCFLTRRRWRELLAECGYVIVGAESHPWTLRPLRRLAGLRASGDIFMLVSAA